MSTNSTSKKELLLAAHAELQVVINEKRISLMEAIIEHEDIGGMDDYASGILAILEKYEGKMPLAQMRQVFADHVQLFEARKALKKSGKITEDEKGTTVTITLVKVVTPIVIKQADAVEIK